MNQIGKIFVTAMVCMGLISCFKDEPLNAECDIEKAWIHADNPNMLFNNLSDTLITVQSDQTSIIFTMQAGADITALAPQFHLTEGATITPENGSVQDFSNGPVVYTVTSEDKKWSRVYTVAVSALLSIGKELHLDFENYSKGSNKFYSWYEQWTTGSGVTSEARIWATGNPGFGISNGSAEPDEYPTVPDENSYEGKGVKLVTRRTSKLADMVKKPIAAGNLFIGRFDAQSALQDAMKATKFGLPFGFESKPITFSGYYKYESGENFTDKDMNVLDMVDKGTIYAVLYDNHDSDGNPVVLYGDNVQTSGQIVALAQVADISTTREWTAFSVNFVYRKDVDAAKLKTGGYSFAVVCSSSNNGASFMGAVGSKLWVDKLTVTCE